MDEITLLHKDKIASLGAQVGQEVLPTLLEIFTQELQQYIGQIQQLTFDEQTRETLARICHAIKGSAPSFGANVLAQKASNMDAQYKKQSWEEFDQGADELISILRRTVYELEQLDL
ncbi:Hpt domain-containing protein [Vibrio rarus]|uniref:Hpt domain-containing protein n=1 Tax=Vibrio rarus TaxID=413403 RepID=UPI0021C49693|nr:Hpt domain-containing protein [Vibrio rarus]